MPKKWGPPLWRSPGSAYFSEWLELDAGRNLPRAIAAEVGASGAGDLAEAVVIDGGYRIRQINMIQEIGERAFHLYLQPLGERERFAQSGREANGSGASYHAYPAVSKPANWGKVHA